MIFWHLGGAIAVFRYVFRDPKVDLRFLALGALLPDLIDKPLGTFLLPEVFRGGTRLIGHTLTLALLMMTVVLVSTRRGRVRRQWMAFAIGALVHLLLDGMWTDQQTFLWPAFGWDFPPGMPDYWSGIFARLLANPWLLLEELAGLSYLIHLWRKAGLGDPARRRELLRTGRVSTA